MPARWPTSACACRARSTRPRSRPRWPTQAEAARSAKAGVNLDEEAARLIQYQQSYQAAAKMLQVAQSLFDTLLQTAALTADTSDRRTMRITTANAFDAAVDNLQRRQQRAEPRRRSS